MRASMRVMILIALAPVLAFGAGGATRQVVLESANMGQKPLEMTLSTISQTGFSFHLAGVELSDKVISASTYQEVKAITDTPEKFGETGQEGLPDLPLYAQLVAIPDQAGVRVEIVSSSFQIIENIDAFPFQLAEYYDGTADVPFTKDEAFYQKNEFYPSEVVQVGEPVICRDLRMIQAVVSPIQYNPVTRQLKVYTSVDYRLVYEGTDTRNEKIRHDNHISETFLPMYRAITPNSDEMLATYQPIRGGYLILYPRNMPDSLVKVLARWKHLKGYSVVAVPDTAIAHHTSPSAAQIFSYIQNAYNNWAVRPEFVCIMGTITSGLVDWPLGGNDSDHHYACVDGTDYLPDIMVTRMSMPITNSTMRTTIWKGIIYDKTPFMGDPNYWTRSLSCAANVSEDLPTLSPRLNVLWVRERLLRHGFTQVDTVFWWNTFDPGTGPITASFNNGVCLSQYRGWGFPQQWGHPDFSVSSLNALQSNNKTGPMCSPTCGTGNFGTTDCFGEHWTTMGTLPNSLKGGPGFFGACGEDTHSKYDNPFMVGYYAAVLMDGIHNFSAASFRAKLELYNTFPFDRASGGLVEHYTHSFNPLGEPEFEIRTGIPQVMAVTYPDSIPVGTSLLTIHVNGSDSLPLAGAYVNLVKGRNPEEVFVGGRTDSSGNITLNFGTTIADTMFVTVTYYNYIPHVGFTLVKTQATAVNIGSIAIDDDSLGNSMGNSDGNANPSETVEYAIDLKNFGTDSTANNVTATLVSFDPNIVVTVPTQSYGAIAAGATATSGKFAIHLAPDLSHGDRYILQLNISSDQGSWTAALPVDIKNMLFVNRGLTFPGNPNNRLDPGETSQFVISLQNMGQLAGTTLSAVLTTSDTSLTITNGVASFGDIGIGATGSNTASPFTIQAHRRIYPGHNSNVTLTLTSNNGSVNHTPLSIVVGAVHTYDPVGPDSYGYYLYDNTDIAYQPCPTFNWVEISPYAGGSGTRVTFPFGPDDDAVVVSGLPFDIHYYGQTFSYLMVSINGFAAFDTTRIDRGGHHWTPWDNNQIPEPSAPDGLIAPFWDDLEFTGNNGVFKYADTTNHRIIFEWKACTHTNAPGNHPETFEMIIYDPAFYPTPTGDCEIVYQYNVVYNDDTDTWSTSRPGLYSTVGMQNLTNLDGLQYTFDNYYHPAAARLAAGRAIKMTTAFGLQQPSHIGHDPNSFVKSIPANQMIQDTLDISNISGAGLVNFTIGEFTDNRILAHGDDAHSRQSIQSETSPYLNDVNSDLLADNGLPPVNPPSILNQGGPDAFGNRWVDSNEPGGPAFNWIDISTVGTPVTIPSDNSFVGPIAMGMNFSFYGTDNSSIFIGSNGILTFGIGSSAYTNVAIPNIAVPNNFLAPLWDDLSPQNGGSVMYYHDTVYNRFIISFTNVPFNGGQGNVNFEAILYPNGRILFEYSSIDGGTRGLNSLTIGIENSTGTDGLQVIYNAVYLHSNMAISFYPQLSWLRSNIHGGSITAGQDTFAIITFDATGLAEGAYTGHLALDSNDPDSGSIFIPVTFLVGTGQAPCNYVVGDINNNGIFNSADVVYAAKYFEGGTQPLYSCECTTGNTWFVAGDVNASCTFNGLDISYIVSFYKGGPGPLPCPACPPGGRLLEPPVTVPVPAVQPVYTPTLRVKPTAVGSE